MHAKISFLCNAKTTLIRRRFGTQGMDGGAYAVAEDRCRIYYYDAHVKTGIGPLPPKKLPRSWSIHHRYNTEAWLSAAIQHGHPWRVRTQAEADVILVGATFAQACIADKKFYARNLWQHVLRDAFLWPVDGGRGIGDMSAKRAAELASDNTADWGPPKAFSMQYPNCPPWVDNNRTAYFPRDAMLLTEFTVSGIDARGGSIITPFVVSQPTWLVSSRESSVSSAQEDLAVPGSDVLRAPLAWKARKLLLFVGHLPKVGISPSRYQIWRQVRRDPRVTTKSHSGNCTIGSYRECEHSKVWLRAQPTSYFVSRCWPYCKNDKRLSCAASALLSPLQNYELMRKDCLRHKPRHSHGNLSAEVSADLHRDASLRWTDSEYYAQAMGHRFCLIVHGDLAGTPKIGEAVNIGSAGGCFPIFVVKLKMGKRGMSTEEALASAVRHSYPYSRWLDYCRIGFFVPEHHATRNMHAVLDALEGLQESELLQKRRALRQVHHAFAFRPNCSLPMAPCATDYILAELCAAAGRLKLNNNMTVRSIPVAGSSEGSGQGLKRCLLL
jgi:hypothetical protein